MPITATHPKKFCRKTGIAQSDISRFESGNHNPSLAFLQHIVEGLGKKVYVEFR
ncbi:helix-turn-helix domain-containing protein [Haemophilus haemolyticus]|uniref:helix-turn-helix domain-containing protein n=1 Tax=Haemophilus haemolyticus TaxID=726 RepID=UPI00195D41C3|nr:helix-turn-helix transcriptional regulator [Haemophilus haemolyticus]